MLATQKTFKALRLMRQYLQLNYGDVTMILNSII